jgi:nitrate reductase delta subunit
VSATRAPTARQSRAAAFAESLVYPHVLPAEAARACAVASREHSIEAAALLEAFAEVAETVPLGALQEEYTRTFDLDTLSRSQPTCHPYVGHYLFDESHKRGAFILGLKRRFREVGFTDESDLPDHLVVLLRFLATGSDEELADELRADAMLPALRRMTALAPATSGSGEARDAYLGVLRALELVLREECPEADDGDDVELELEREWARGTDSLGIDRTWC